MTAISTTKLQPKQTFTFSSSLVNALIFKISIKLFFINSYNHIVFEDSSDALLTGVPTNPAGPGFPVWVTWTTFNFNFNLIPGKT